MDEDRPEKKTIRKLWIQRIKESSREETQGPFPLYLTLSGSGGRDIELLSRRGIIGRSEVGGIATRDLEKVVAVESNSQAVLILQKKFPGLKILEYPFHNLVRSTNPVRWPQGQDEKYCSAHIVNLDLNQPLVSEEVAGQTIFPILQWIGKLAQIHAVSQRRVWHLFLTLHAQISWPAGANNVVKDFLRENFQMQSEFATASQLLMGDELYGKIASSDNLNFSQLCQSDQQKVLMTFVPKKIAKLVVDQGWLVITQRNIRYGGAGHAPMVTWIMRFIWDTRVSSTPQAVYTECLKSVLAKCGYIEENGHLS
jgi:hypothetical protein